MATPLHSTSASCVVVGVAGGRLGLGESRKVATSVCVFRRGVLPASCKRRLRCSREEGNVAAPAADVAPAAPPTIDLEILGPEVGDVVTTTSVGSGEKLLRNIILDNKLELYGLYGKVMNCGGGGSCGTCIVEILEGKELLNERTDAEYKYLKKKPEGWRLSCQTIVGDKSNSGKVVVQRLPQKKKK
jgi:ferredoxin